jgi:hypothetical protein
MNPLINLKDVQAGPKNDNQHLKDEQASNGLHRQIF